MIILETSNISSYIGTNLLKLSIYLSLIQIYRIINLKYFYYAPVGTLVCQRFSFLTYVSHWNVVKVHIIDLALFRNLSLGFYQSSLKLTFDGSQNTGTMPTCHFINIFQSKFVILRQGGFMFCHVVPCFAMVMGILFYLKIHNINENMRTIFFVWELDLFVKNVILNIN